MPLWAEIHENLKVDNISIEIERQAGLNYISQYYQAEGIRPGCRFKSTARLAKELGTAFVKNAAGPEGRNSTHGNCPSEIEIVFTAMGQDVNMPRIQRVKVPEESKI